jgi:hypothetical protein
MFLHQISHTIPSGLKEFSLGFTYKHRFPSGISTCINFVRKFGMSQVWKTTEGVFYLQMILEISHLPLSLTNSNLLPPTVVFTWFVPSPSALTAPVV